MSIMVKFIPKGIKYRIIFPYLLENKYGKISYAQEAEDLLLDHHFKKKSKGFYVDIGAYHPISISNTYFFYKKGWTGINIDARPGSMEEFRKVRPLDINLEYGISNKEEELTYYMFNEPALNTFSEVEAIAIQEKMTFKLVEKRKIKCLPIQNILNEFIPEGVQVDIINIDIEGMDFKILKDIDIAKFSPEALLIEYKNGNLEKITSYMKKMNYQLEVKTRRTLIFFRRNTK